MRKVRGFRRTLTIAASAALFCGLLLWTAAIRGQTGWSAWLQTSWGGGPSPSPAAQTGWDKYSSKTGGISIDVNNKATLAQQLSTLSFPDTSGSFNLDSTQTHNIDATISPASLKLNISASDSFVTGLDKWRTLPTIPAPGSWTRYAVTPDRSYIYCIFVSGDGKQFGRYSIAAQTWEFLQPLPKALAAGASIACDSQYVYVLRGGGSKEAYYFDPSAAPANAWTSIVNNFPASVQKGTVMAITDTPIAGGGNLYVAAGGTNSLYKYTKGAGIADGSWAFVRSLPSTIMASAGSGLAYYNNSLYFEGGSGQPSSVYTLSLSNIAAGWTTTGGALPSGDSSPSCPAPSFNDGAGLWYPGSGNYLYAAGAVNAYLRPYRSAGSNVHMDYRGFYSYGPLGSNPQWSRLDDLPASSKGYGFIIYDPNAGKPSAGQEIDFFSGSNYTRPWIFDSLQKHWKTLSQFPMIFDSPVSFHNLAALCYVKGDPPQGGDYVYSVGYDYRSFLRYSVTRNVWELLAPTLEDIDGYSIIRGEHLAHMNGYIYCLIGPSKGFYRYSVSQAPPNDAWDNAVPQYPTANNHSTSIVGVSAADGDYIYSFGMEFVNNVKDNIHLYRLKIGDANWQNLSSLPPNLPPNDYLAGTSVIYTGHPEPDGGKYIYFGMNASYTANYAGSALLKYGPVDGTPAWTVLRSAKNGDMVNPLYPGSLAYPDDTKPAIYTLSNCIGYASSNFGKYDMDTGAWASLDSTPFSQGFGDSVGGRNYIYTLAYYNNADNFWRYDSASDTWTYPVIDRGGPIQNKDLACGSVVSDGNFIYLFTGEAPGNSNKTEVVSHVWVYGSNEGRWVRLIRAPFVIGAGTKAEYLPGAIYVTQGNNSARFWRLDLGTFSWTRKADLPSTPGIGCQLTGDGGNKIYFAAGSTSSNDPVYSYDTGADNWQPIGLNVTYQITNNCRVLEYANGSLYLLCLGKSDFSCWASGGTGWNPLKPVQRTDGARITVSGAASLYYPGSGDYIYCIPVGNGDTTFLRYSIGGDGWISRADLPNTLTSANPNSISDLASVSGGNYLYAYNSAWDNRFIRYSLQDDAWDDIARLPIADIGTHSAFCGYGGYIYYLAGDPSANWPGDKQRFYRYDPVSGKWNALSPPPSGIYFNRDGICALSVTYNGSAYIYFTSGAAVYSSDPTYFYRYNIALNSWEQRVSPPAAFGQFAAGNSMAQVGNYIYVAKGSGTTIWQYDIGSNSWSEAAMPNPGPSMSSGASMVYTGGNYVYALNGGHSTGLYRCSVSGGRLTGSWTNSGLAPCPVSANDGSAQLLYPGVGSYIYFLQGSAYSVSDQSPIVFKYNFSSAPPNGNKWTEIASSPFGITGQAALVYPGTGNDLYAASGTGVFAKYRSFYYGDCTSNFAEIGKHCGWGQIDWAGNNADNIKVYVRTANAPAGFFDQGSVVDWSQIQDTANNQSLTPPPSGVRPTDRYIQYRLKFLMDTDNISMLPSLSALNIGWLRYPTAQTIESSPLDTGFLNNRIRQITWDLAPSGNIGGSAVKLQLRSAKTVSDLTTAPWLGPGGTHITRYLFSDPNLYAASSHIDISGNQAMLRKELDDFMYYIPVTITNNSTDVTMAAGDVALIDIPPSLADFWANIQPDGRDVRFTDKDNILPYYLYNFDIGTKNATVAVKIMKSIPPQSSQTIYMVFGNNAVFSESDNTVRSYISYQNTTSSNALKGWWDPEEGLGATTIADKSSFSKPMTIKGGVAWTDDGIQWKDASGTLHFRALSLDGSTGELDLSPNTTFYNYQGGARTYCFWIKSRQINGEGNFYGPGYSNDFAAWIYGEGDNYRLRVAGNGYYPYFGGKVPEDEKWHNIIVTLQGSTIKGYIDNVLQLNRTDFPVSSAGAISRYMAFKGSVDIVAIYDRVFDPVEVKYFYYGANKFLSSTFGVRYDNRASPIGMAHYYTDNPVVQPVFGVFYEETDTLAQFTPNTTLPAGTAVKFQVSPDGYNWYYWNGTAWTLAAGGYSTSTNTASEISSHLSTFKNIALPSGASASSGDFYWRAWLHSDNGISTPALTGVTIALVSGASADSYYVDPAGSELINELNEDCLDDRWVQYRATLYSDGENAPTLNSVTLSYEDPRITLHAPNGGETWLVADPNQRISWSAQGLESIGRGSGGFNIYYSVDDGLTWKSIAANVCTVPVEPYEFPWAPIPYDLSTCARVKIASSDYPAVTAISANSFQIVGLVATEPAAGMVWETGQNHNIAWQINGYTPAQADSQTLCIDYSADGGVNWVPIVANQKANTSPYLWGVDPETFPFLPADNVLIRIYDKDPFFCYNNDPNTPRYAYAEPVGIIPPPAITITKPLSGDQLIAGLKYHVTGSTNSKVFAPKLIIEYSIDGGNTWPYTAGGDTAFLIANPSSGASTSVPPNPNGSLKFDVIWQPPNTYSDNVQIRVREDASSTLPPFRDTKTAISQTSEIFSISSPSVNITRPVLEGTDTWVAGDAEDINWDLVGNVIGPLKIEYSTDYLPSTGAGTWNLVTAATAGDDPSNVAPSSKTFKCVVPNASSAAAYIKITDNDVGTEKISGKFTILSQEKTEITAPLAGEALTIGVPYNITWKVYGKKASIPTNKFNILYAADGVSYKPVPGAVGISPANGLFTWDFAQCPFGTPLVSTTNAMIKIVCPGDHNFDAYTTGQFNVFNPKIAITSPSGANDWYATGNYNIEWTSTGSASNDVTIKYWDGLQLNTVYSGAVNDLGPGANPGEEKHSYNDWKVPDNAGAARYVQVTDNTRPTVVGKSGDFNIVSPTITITSPDASVQGAGAWVAGEKHAVSWTTTGGDVGAIASLNVDCVIGGVTVSSDAITNSAVLHSNSGSISNWTVPDTVSMVNAVIHVYDPARPATTASQQFAISPPAIGIDSPAPGDIWKIGSSGHSITWHLLGGVQYPLTINCVLSKGTVLHIADIPIAALPLTSYAWAVDTAGITAGAAKIRIVDSHSTPIVAEMAQSFMIGSPSINVNGPQGELWTETDTRNVKWSYDGKVTAPLTIDWSNDNFATAHMIGTAALTDTSYAWSIPHEAVGANVKIRITDSSSPDPVVSYSALFTIFPVPLITIAAPNSTNFNNQPGGAWLMGNKYAITWTDNGGAISNNLKLQWSVDNGATWNDIADGVSNSGSFDWVIPHSPPITPSTNAKIRIYDNVPWNSKTGEHLDILSLRFEIGRPVIIITSPADTDYIALNETPTIKWNTDGWINDDLSLTLVTGSGAAAASIAGAQHNTGIFTGWPVPNTLLAGLYAVKIEDSSSAYGVYGTSKLFNVIQEPQVTIVTPNGDPTDDYVMDSSTIHFHWNSKGLSVTRVKIELSSDDFNTTYTVPATGYAQANLSNPASYEIPNAGSYDWYITPDPGVPAGVNTVKARITRLDAIPNYGHAIYGQSANPFTIRSGFAIQSPAAGSSWATNETRNITWTTKGNIPKVNLDYSVDGGATYTPITGAQNIDNIGTYAWTVPNQRTASAVIRVKDATDPTGQIQNVSSPFNIIWYTIKFYVIDIDTFDPLQGLNVSDSPEGSWAGWTQWEVTDNHLKSPQDTSHEYPYGKYQATWSMTDAANYFPRTIAFTADSNNKTVLVEMENKISAQLEWHVIVSTSYQAGTDLLTGQAWIERRGILQQPPTMEGGARDYSNFHIFTIGLYDYDNPSPDAPPILSYTADAASGQLPDANGVYKFSWRPTGLMGGRTYFVKATMTYGAGNGQLYKSGTTVDITAATQLANIQTTAAAIQAQTTAIQTQAAAIQTAVETTLPQKIEAAKASIETKVDTATTAIKQETSKILTATGTESLPAQITAARNTARSEILNRENTARTGQALAIQYRTPADSAFIDVYDASNVQRINKQPMLPLPNAGTADLKVYQYLVNFDQAWERGDFTVVCSDSAGNMDALIISVLSSTLEDVAGNVAAILGNTASMNEFKDVAESLNSQFSVIETVLTKLGKELVGGPSAQVTSMMDSVHSQLSALSRQMRQVAGKTNVSLDKLYQVSVDKKSDMMYLKNKTQELKAAMEINKQMVDNIANKAVTQTWYEYK